MPKWRSKFVHAYLDQPKKEFSDVPNLYTDGDNSGNIAASCTMMAMAKTGAGGPVMVTPLLNYGRWSNQTKIVATSCGGKCTALNFSPHNQQLLAIGGDSGLVDLVNIPEDGMASQTENLTKPDMRLNGHNKKVQYIAWNKLSRNILATSSFDKDLCIWDAEVGTKLYSAEDVSESTPTDLVWDSAGQSLIYGSKSAKASIIDLRAPETEKREFEAFNGKKGCKFWFMPKLGWIGGLGITKGNKHTIKIWEMGKLDKTIFQQDLNAVRNKAFVHYDQDIGQLYIWNKGSTQITQYEINDKPKKMHFLNTHQTQKADQFKAGCFLPKRALDTSRCEIGAFMGNFKSQTNTISRLSIITPRKATSFQADLFPESWNGEPSQESEQWNASEAAEFILSSMNPDSMSTEKKAVRIPYNQLLKENEELKARLAKYEEAEKQSDM